MALNLSSDNNRVIVRCHPQCITKFIEVQAQTQTQADEKKNNVPNNVPNNVLNNVLNNIEDYHARISRNSVNFYKMAGDSLRNANGYGNRVWDDCARGSECSLPNDSATLLDRSELPDGTKKTYHVFQAAPFKFLQSEKFMRYLMITLGELIKHPELREILKPFEKNFTVFVVNYLQEYPGMRALPQEFYYLCPLAKQENSCDKNCNVDYKCQLYEIDSGKIVEVEKQIETFYDNKMMERRNQKIQEQNILRDRAWELLLKGPNNQK